MKNKKWSEMSPVQQKTTIVFTAVEIGLTTWAAIDLIRRDPAQVRGPKLAWAPALVVQPIGPIAYLVWGRRG